MERMASKWRDSASMETVWWAGFRKVVALDPLSTKALELESEVRGWASVEALDK